VVEEIHRGRNLGDSLRAHALPKGGVLGKSFLVAAYNEMVADGTLAADMSLFEKLRMKPMRTLSGVTTVTVLTKPYPCPGKCIFCPEDVRMPKSYLPDEPGAMRAVEHGFNPFAQVASRLEALSAVGHPTDKIELLILGGTFSAYRRDYQADFILNCFRAMNEDVRRGEHRQQLSASGVNAGEIVPLENPQGKVHPELHALEVAHFENESALHRNVGLSVETRPDEITPDELAWFRSLGVTKVQMGVQSLDDSILEINQRGHTVADAHRAVALLRAAGFKIVLHWMPNLMGATPDSDRVDFLRLWEGLCPDEIKIYPTQLLENAPLYAFWKRGDYHPYSTDELIQLIADVKPSIPRYCRVNRIIRDIPSTHVVEGNKRTSLRQDVQMEMTRRGTHCDCIRCREVRGEQVETSSLRLDDLVYHPDGAEEHFLSFVTPEDQMAGFLRLSLPGIAPPNPSTREHGHPVEPVNGSPITGLQDLDGAALIREIHVYGQSLAVGTGQSGAAQHMGLGTRLLAQADVIARANGFKRMAVIAAVGTRQYYLERGFERGALYLVKGL